VTCAGCADRLDQLTQAGQKSIVTDSQKRSAGNVANARGFDDHGSRLAFGEPSIPIQVVLGDKAIFSSPPGHHGGDPGAGGQLKRTNFDRLKQ
jgi:hypothetical protein